MRKIGYNTCVMAAKKQVFPILGRLKGRDSALTFVCPGASFPASWTRNSSSGGIALKKSQTPCGGSELCVAHNTGAGVKFKTSESVVSDFDLKIKVNNYMKYNTFLILYFLVFSYQLNKRKRGENQPSLSFFLRDLNIFCC